MWLTCIPCPIACDKKDKFPILLEVNTGLGVPRPVMLSWWCGRVRLVMYVCMSTLFSFQLQMCAHTSFSSRGIK